MTLIEEIERGEGLITHCLDKGFGEDRIGKQNIEDAMDSLVPLLGYVGRIEAQTEEDYLLAKGNAIANADVRGERLKITFAESAAGEEKSLHTRAKRLCKSLDVTVSLLQSRLKEIKTL